MIAAHLRFCSAPLSSGLHSPAEFSIFFVLAMDIRMEFIRAELVKKNSLVGPRDFRPLNTPLLSRSDLQGTA
jgi:hypothetical protein